MELKLVETAANLLKPFNILYIRLFVVIAAVFLFALCPVFSFQ